MLGLSTRPLIKRWQIASSAAFASALIVLCAAGANAQMGGIDSDPSDPGTGGRNTVQGTIFLPGGRRMDRRVKVKLVGLTSGEQFRMSDDSGSFSFRHLQGGRYTLVVAAGQEFEVASEPVDIIEPARRRESTGVTVPVYITLQPKSSRQSKAAPLTRLPRQYPRTLASFTNKRRSRPKQAITRRRSKN